jgi:hypothetical protein
MNLVSRQKVPEPRLHDLAVLMDENCVALRASTALARTSKCKKGEMGSA